MEEQVINAIATAFTKAIEDASLEMTANVEEKIYGSKPTRYYDRTSDFLKSVANPKIKIVGEEFEAYLYNKDFIRSRNGAKGKFGHHKSFPWSEPYPSNEYVKENLFDWLNDGFTILGKRRHLGFDFDFDTDTLIFKQALMYANEELDKIGF